CTHPPLPSFPPRRSSDLTTCNVQRVTDSMAQIVSLAASPRQAAGKGAARQVRLQGKVPAVIYGHGRETQALEVGAKALEKALTGVEPQNTIIELAVDGKKTKTLIREIQRHPLRPDIIHVDF